MQRCADALSPCLCELLQVAGHDAGEEADRLDAGLGIPVLRHTEKKPAGGAGSLEKHFGCAAACPCLPQALQRPAGALCVQHPVPSLAVQRTIILLHTVRCVDLG